MLRPSRIHIGSIKIRMAGFQHREKSADAFLEDAFVRAVGVDRTTETLDWL